MIPDPSSPLPPLVTSRTETTLGSTAVATAFQFGLATPLLTSGAEFWLGEVLLVEGSVVVELVSCALRMPSVKRLDSTAAAAPTAITPPQPGPRRSRWCGGCGAGDP